MKTLMATALALFAVTFSGRSSGEETLTQEQAEDPVAALTFTYFTCVRIKSEEYAATDATASEISEAALFKCDTYVATLEKEIYRQVREEHPPETARAISKNTRETARASARGLAISAVLDKRASAAK